VAAVVVVVKVGALALVVAVAVTVIAHWNRCSNCHQVHRQWKCRTRYHHLRTKIRQESRKLERAEVGLK